MWADGLYVKAGLEDSKAALRVMIGALTDGRKVVLAVESGPRESKESWGTVLRDLRTRGSSPGGAQWPRGLSGSGPPWETSSRPWPSSGVGTTGSSMCFVNVLDAMPQKVQPEARALLTAMPSAETQGACERVRAQFTPQYRTLAPKAVARLGHEGARLVTFYQFPREPGCQLRTTNVGESPFAAVRLRTTAAKRYKRIASATARIWKLLQIAAQTFRRLKAPAWLPAVYAGAQYVDGVQTHRAARQEVAA